MTTITEAVRSDILARLKAIESSEQVRIILAVESGSRAWGFPSVDSDYDVRFVYIRETNWYLQLVEGRDVIEPATDGLMDFAGWDVRKALKLMLQSNANLLEWLESPIVYRANAEAVTELRKLSDKLLSIKAMRWHYLRLAERQLANLGDGQDVSHKRYLYVLRPALMLRHLRLHNRRPPMGIDALLAETDVSFGTRQTIARFIARKAISRELGSGPRVALFDALILDEMSAARDLLSGTHAAMPTTQAIADANAVFLQFLGREPGAAA